MSGYENHNPDVLSCLASLSNDEVFTPPTIVNKMLDLLPKNIWSDSSATFLDPCCKSGVFLREIAKRLLSGLSNEIPDLQERINHIFTKQLYGIAITELTSLISKRTIYCSKEASSEYSVCNNMENVDGNIFYKSIKHTWKNTMCVFCGATKEKYDRTDISESYAYPFIHKTFNEEIKQMKFDVIIGNPPYQLNLGLDGGNSSSSKSIYNLFIDQGIKLNPHFLCMITPSKWMTKAARGIPEKWVDDMLQKNKIRTIHDYENANDCFPGVEIKGGVSFFLWDRDYVGKCEYVFHPSSTKEIFKICNYLDPLGTGIVIRDPRSYSILLKIINIEGNYYKKEDTSFSGLVSPKHFFDKGEVLTTNWSDYKDQKDETHYIKYYVSKTKNDEEYGWVSEDQIPKNKEIIGLNKVYIPAAGGSGSDKIVLGKPFVGEPNSVCSQTYLIIGYDANKHNFTRDNCENIVSYIKTKFFRYLVSIKKKTQHSPRGVYQFVPLQDFNKQWTDRELYKKYSLDENEINFIESSIRELK